MPNPVGGPSGFPGPPVIPAEGSVWVFTGGKWIASNSLPGPLSVIDAQFSVVGSADATKTFRVEVDAQSTGADLTLDTGAQTVDRTLSVPVLTASATLAVLSETQTFTGDKSFTGMTTVTDNMVTTGSADATKTFRVEVDTQTAGADFVLNLGGQTADRTLSVPVLTAAATLAVLSETQTFTGAKEFASGITVSSGNISFTGGQTLLAPTGDVYMRAGTGGQLRLGAGGSNDLFLISSTGVISIPNTTNATSPTAAAVLASGGIAVTKNIIGAMGRGTGITSTATAAGTTTLTATSTELQAFTGVTTQTIQFPAANLFGAGVSVLFTINNQSTGTVTPTRAGADTFQGGGTTDPVLAGASMDYRSDGVSVWLRC